MSVLTTEPGVLSLDAMASVAYRPEAIVLLHGRALQGPVEADASSGSGLDPDMSPQCADIQVHRVAGRNGLSVAGWRSSS